MVWEQRAATVVMMTKLEEKSRVSPLYLLFEAAALFLVRLLCKPPVTSAAPLKNMLLFLNKPQNKITVSQDQRHQTAADSGADLH